MAMEVISSALLKLLCEKVASKCLKELGMLLDVDKNLEKLESTLTTIQDVLKDAEARQFKEKALKGWLRKLKDVAYDADDVLDEFITKAAKWKPDIEHQKKGKVSKLLSIPKLKFQYEIAHKIKEIRERLDEIAEERSKFHLRESSVKQWKEEIVEREETGSVVNESEVLGRDEDREKIVGFLINTSSKSNPDVLPIVGLGGLGKTTLAQLVFNDKRVCKHFEHRVWVCVSDEFDGRRLIRSIIESLIGRECDLTDMNSLQWKLRQLLGSHRFLLVLDDVWNENHEKWDKLRILLTDCAMGGKIIVTSRSARVASIMGTVAPYFLTGLANDDCWSLFEKRAFGLGGATKTLNLVAIGRDIVKKCGGVPLAAKALGSLMRFRKGENAWIAVRDNDIWKLSEDENEILPALMLSYNHLPSRLKPCFAYCSIFPKNYEVRKEKLVHLWMAEGLIQSFDANLHLVDVGHHYIDELLSRSLFQDGAQDEDGTVRQVKMHDLVHDLACSIAGDECSILDSAMGRSACESSRYVSFISNGPISATLLHEAKKLRTFYLVAAKHTFVLSFPADKSFKIDLLAASKHEEEERVSTKEEEDRTMGLLHNNFSNFKRLRALHLSGCPMKELPVLISKMKHLRYLDLATTKLEDLPPCIGLLHNLQTLSLSYCRRLHVLPESIGQLYNLSTLDLKGCISLQSLPSSIGGLKNLRKLDLSFCQFIQELPESFSCLSNLQVLSLEDCFGIHELPSNMKEMEKLIHLDISGCSKLTCMPAGIGELTHLQTLPIFVLGGKSKCAIGELSGLNIEGTLHIKKLENAMSPAEAREANLKGKHGLRFLRLSWDTNAYREPIHASEDSDGDATEQSTRHFTDVLVSHFFPYAETVDGILENLQPFSGIEKLWIERYVGRNFASWMMELTLPNLVEVKLESCIRCDRLPAFGKLPHLKILSLKELFSIRCLGSDLYGGNGAFPVLEVLELSALLSLEEWSETSGEELFPSLTTLCLQGCPMLQALPSAFPTVTHLTMDVDDELLLSALQNGSFPNLKFMGIGNCNRVEVEEDCMEDMPGVLTERMRTMDCWLVQTRPRPHDDDPSISCVKCVRSLKMPAGMLMTYYKLEMF